MNAKQLLEHFERISEAPEAIPRLRRLILDLAVRGKLVEQDPSDETAEAELIQARERLEKAAETTKRLRWKRPRKIELSEITKDVPSGWTPARVNDTGLYINGLAFKPTDWKQSGLPIIRIQNLTDPDKEFNYAQGQYPDEVTVQNGDLLVSWSATLEAFKWERGQGVLNQHIFRVIAEDKLVSRDFLLLLLRNAIREMADGEHAHGLVMTHINRGPFLDHIVLIPPLAEQHRIVARVDELMSLCDQLEAAKAERDQCLDSLVASSLQGLNQPAEEEETFREHARFTFNNLPRITTRATHIKQLRQTILNLAVRGKLVPQDPNHEPAAELLKRIAAEKMQLVKSGKTKKEKSLPKPDLDLAPFELPAGWAWGRFPELGKFGRGKSKHRPRNDPALFEGGSHLMIQTGDVARSNGVIKTYTSKYNDLGLSQSLKWPKGALCITIAANIADSGILSFEACFPDSVVGFVPASMFENARYFEYFVRTAKASLLEYAPATAQKNINLEILSQVLIPLPPLAEQNRIVAKVDELMAVCDQLEAQIAEAEQDSRRYLEAVLQDALAPAVAEAA